MTTTAQQLPDLLPDLDWIADPLRVGRLSQDFAWFSPVLKRDLAGKRGDIAVRPRTEAEIRQVVAACASAGIPLTVRGSGTGNYGQSTPLHGGVILDLSGYNAFGWVRGGVGRAQSGIRLADFDAQAKPQGQELRWLPSTYRSATLGGLFGGGFGGAGSINHGPLAAPGNVLAVRAMTVEPEPQIIELRGPEAMLLHHTYGTNGIDLPKDKPWLVNLMDKDKIRKDITEARKHADVVMVFPHWGTENSHKVSDYQKEYTKLFSDLGVDIVIGSHPHVLQPVAWVTNEKSGKKMLVYYSLGNFISHQINLPQLCGGMAEVTIEKDNGKINISSAKLAPVVCHYSRGGNGFVFSVYKLSDYTDELAATQAQKGATVKYFTDLSKKVIPAEFLDI